MQEKSDCQKIFAITRSHTNKKLQTNKFLLFKSKNF